jgi:hypothetical protein
MERWCERGDLNPHGLLRQILSLVRLPISPLSRGYNLLIVSQITSPNNVLRRRGEAGDGPRGISCRNLCCCIIARQKSDHISGVGRGEMGGGLGHGNRPVTCQLCHCLEVRAKQRSASGRAVPVVLREAIDRENNGNPTIFCAYHQFSMLGSLYRTKLV